MPTDIAVGAHAFAGRLPLAPMRVDCATAPRVPLARLTTWKGDLQ